MHTGSAKKRLFAFAANKKASHKKKRMLDEGSDADAAAAAAAAVVVCTNADHNDGDGSNFLCHDECTSDSFANAGDY